MKWNLNTCMKNLWILTRSLVLISFVKISGRRVFCHFQSVSFLSRSQIALVISSRFGRNSAEPCLLINHARKLPYIGDVFWFRRYFDGLDFTCSFLIPSLSSTGPRYCSLLMEKRHLSGLSVILLSLRC